jgi:hypothetical protein
MLNQTLFLKVKQRLNKLDSQDYDNLECWQVIEAYNKAAKSWTRRQIQGVNILQVGDEQTTVKIDDLQVLLTVSPLTLTNRTLYYESDLLPDDYLGFKRIQAYIKKECCTNKEILNVYLVEEVNVPTLLRDELSKPSFQWGETFCTIINNRIRIYTNEDFIIEEPVLMYYKQPTLIQIENCVDPYTGELSLQNVESEFKDDLIELIIDDAVAIIAGDIESMTQLQINNQRSEKNT